MDLALTPVLVEHHQCSPARRRPPSHRRILSLVHFFLFCGCKARVPAGRYRTEPCGFNLLLEVCARIKATAIGCRSSAYRDLSPTGMQMIPSTFGEVEYSATRLASQPLSEISALWTVFSLFGFIQMQHQLSVSALAN